MIGKTVGALLLSALWGISPVQAQTTDVVCLSNFNYLNNKEGQNPCLVAAYLQAPCSADGKNFDVPALKVNQSYIGPQTANINYCGCSSVIYSLISACAQCQGSQWISWSYWRTNCPTGEVTVGQYPLDIPEGTGVPAWAYQDVALSDRWNASLALPQIATGTESTYYGTPTASVSYHVTTTGDVGTGTAAATSQTASSSSGSKSNAGAIAGGVVGGLALLALIGALVWLIIRRRRQQGLAPSPVAYFPPGGPQMAQANNADGHYPAAVDYGASYPPTSPTAFSGDDSRATPKLYDPSDPSTFPKTPTSFGYQSTLITDTTGADHSATTGGRYTGAAEI